MKWFFYFLLVANLGLFIWIYPQSTVPEPADKLPEGVESLVLLKELAPDTAEETWTAAVVETASETPMQSQQTTPAPAQPGVSEAVMAEESKPDMAVEAAVRDSLPMALAEETEMPVDGGEADFPLQGGTAQLPPPHEPEAKPIRHCRTIGPLNKRADADKLSLRLRALGVQPEMQSESSNEQEGYWVLVPPQSSRAQAVQIVERLKQSGITDLWRFTSGRLAHAISLGLFRNEGRAEIRRKSIADKGFEVEVRPRYRQKTSYWLAYSYQGEPPLSDRKWSEILADSPEIERRDIDCQEIASQ